MDQLRPNAKVLFTVLFISQVCGIPTFYWSQPDCYQQSNYDSYNTGYGSYQGPDYQDTNYQGPSYQETLQGMIEESLKAVREIVQITVKATKNELAELSNLWYQNIANADCNLDVEYGDTPDIHQPNVYPEQNIVFEGQPMNIQHMIPNTPEIQDPTTLGHLTPTDNKLCTSSEPPSIDNKVGSEHKVSSMSTPSEHKPNHQIFVDVHDVHTKSPDTITSTTESTSSEGPTSNSTHEENSNKTASPSTEATAHNGSESPVNTLADEMSLNMNGGSTTDGVSETTHSTEGNNINNRLTETSTLSVSEEMSTFSAVTDGSTTDGTTDITSPTSAGSTVSTLADELTSTSFTTGGPSTEDFTLTTTANNDSSIGKQNSTTAFDLMTKPPRKPKL